MTSPAVQNRNTQTTATRATAAVWTPSIGTLVDGDVILGVFTITEDIIDAAAWTFAHNGTGAAAVSLYDNGVDFGICLIPIDATNAANLTTVTTTTSAARRKAAIFYRISGCTHSGGTNLTTLSTRAQGTSTAPDPSTVTATTSGLDNLFIAICGNPVLTSGAITPTAAPSGYSNLQTAVLDDVKDCYLGSAEKAATADSDDPGAFTIDTSFDWTAIAVCLQGTVSAGGDTTVTGIIDTLALTTGTATISPDANITGTLAALALAEGTAAVSNDITISCITDALTLTEGTAVVVTAAYPTIAAVDTQQKITEEASSVFTLNLGALVEGDLIIAACYISDIVDASGWAVSDNGTGADPTIIYNNSLTGCIIRKVVEASDVSTLTTITFTSPTALGKVAAFYRVQGHTHTTNATTISLVTQGSSTLPNPLAVNATTSSLSNLFLAFCGGPAGTAGAITPTAAPSGYTNLLTEVMNSTKDSWLGTARKFVAADSEDAGAFTITPASVWVAHTVCIQGAAAAGDTNVTTTTSALVLVEGTASISLDKTVSAAVASLVLSAGVASISADASIVTTSDALALSEGTASVALDVSVLALSDSLVLTEGTASISISSDVDVLGITDDLTLSEGAATISNDITVATTSDSLTLAEGVAAVALDRGVLGTTATLTLAEGVASIAADISVLGVTDALTLSEGSALIALSSGIVTVTDSLTLTENTATVSLDRNILSTVAALTLTEATALVSLGINVLGTTDALVLVEGSALVSLDKDVACTTEALTLAEGLALISTGAAGVLGITDTLILAEGTASVAYDRDILGITAALTLTAGVANLAADVTVYAIRKRLNLTAGVAVVALSTVPTPATADSIININLGNVPQIDDPQVYEAVLQVHSAIEAILEYLNAQA